MALVGKHCPSIGGLTFVKGNQVSIPSGGPLVIELWASWCGPCRVAFPHLSSLQRKFKDKGLLVVGICLEDDVAAARRFVEQQGANMDYTVAVDGRGEAGDGLMRAAGVSGIPFAVVVDYKGIVRFQGHPMDPAFEKAVQQVAAEGKGAPWGQAAGSYEAADRAFVAEQRLRRFQQQQQE